MIVINLQLIFARYETAEQVAMELDEKDQVCAKG